MTTARSAVAAGYINAHKSSPSKSPAARELEGLRAQGSGGVGDLARRFTASSLGEDSPSKRQPVIEIEGKSKATGVDAMRKYREAKEAAARAEASPSGERAAPPPKVDLFK